MIITQAQTDYFIDSSGKEHHRIWTVGGRCQGCKITILEYNLTFNSLDIYLDSGQMIRVFNIRELLYAEKEDLSVNPGGAE